ncbi:TNF receptor-associated factor 4-like [Orbicella faveolata]|uniref:TNF receptor-associated factor 4-like n=1 Tax=Orbicella faveolata TaxID=48498 RepID=UPI0009E48F20|nr:TNF receptor-associated factor 4-like [Orbicella faveolata]
MLRSLIAFQNHQERCPYKIVQCPSLNCGVKLARNLIEEHLSTACLWKIVTCQFCNDNHPKSQEHMHNESCPMFPVSCINGCEKIVPRGQVRQFAIPVMYVRCAGAEIKHAKKVERRHLERHIEDQTTVHLGLACKKIVQLNREFDHEKTNLRKQLEDLKKENDNLVLKVSVQEKEMQKTKTESPIFLWKITGFSEMLRQAKSGRNNKMDSEPFYTGPYGYKLKLSVNPNGDGSGKNTHLSAFVIVMKGEYDAVLSWPFHQKVTFTLIDQQDNTDERENIVMHFRANPKLENFARPTEEEKPGRGYARFVSHERLRSRRYIVDDSLFIRVDVDSP